jgi:prevent-host-death family protein
MAEMLPMAEARARLSELVDRVRRTREAVILTRNGRPAVVLVDPDEWTLASAALEAAEDAAASREYADAMAEWDGTTVSHDQLLAELDQDESDVTRRVAG